MTPPPTGSVLPPAARPGADDRAPRRAAERRLLATVPEPPPSRSEAADALRTLLRWIGEDPDRSGLVETPDRVLRAFGELCAGYRQDPDEVLRKTFDEVADYDGPVIVRDIPFSSLCEHHMLPFQGVAHVAYLPSGRVVGLSKLARLVEVFARRLQIQERMTAQIAAALERVLRPRGVAVVVSAEHQCMAMRGVQRPGARTVTSTVTGIWRDEASLRAQILGQLQG